MSKELTTAERTLEIIDISKTRDWLTRDVIVNYGTTTIPAGTLPYTAYSAIKARPGKGGGYVTRMGEVQQAGLRQARGRRRSCSSTDWRWKR